MATMNARHPGLTLLHDHRMLLHIYQLVEAIGENTEITDDSCPEDKF
jgi:hypothetical protein